MSHDDCIFCKIIDGEIPSVKVFENEHVYAFLDISQVTKGHTLIIPKQHTRNLYDTTEDIARELFSCVPQIANAIKDAFNASGMNLINNNEAIASQTVFHLHLHLIPKYKENEGYDAKWPTHVDDYKQDDLQDIATKIQTNLE